MFLIPYLLETFVRMILSIYHALDQCATLGVAQVSLHVLNCMCTIFCVFVPVSSATAEHVRRVVQFEIEPQNRGTIHIHISPRNRCTSTTVCSHWLQCLLYLHELER